MHSYRCSTKKYPIQFEYQNIGLFGLLQVGLVFSNPAFLLPFWWGVILRGVPPWCLNPYPEDGWVEDGWNRPGGRSNCRVLKGLQEGGGNLREPKGFRFGKIGLQLKGAVGKIRGISIPASHKPSKLSGGVSKCTASLVVSLYPPWN